MSMVYCKKTRRQFLVGTGKTLLALPLLPSLLPSEAQAQALPPAKKMMLFWFDHNPYQPQWPQRGVANTPVGSSGAMEILMKQIGTATSISNNYRHPLWQTLI